jgi:ankyrin repeat protein
MNCAHGTYTLRILSTQGHTPTLHLAATLGLGDMVEVLVEAGANPAVTNKVSAFQSLFLS